jgi:hypothetical protein
MQRPNAQRFLTAAALACVLLATAAGCALHEQMRAARDAISAEQVPGIKDRYAISWGWPQSWQEFSEIQSRPFSVAASDHLTGTRESQ